MKRSIGAFIRPAFAYALLPICIVAIGRLIYGAADDILVSNGASPPNGVERAVGRIEAGARGMFSGTGSPTSTTGIEIGQNGAGEGVISAITAGAMSTTSVPMILDSSRYEINLNSIARASIIEIVDTGSVESARIGLNMTLPDFSIDIDHPFSGGDSLVHMTTDGTGTGSTEGGLVGVLSTGETVLFNQENTLLWVGSTGDTLISGDETIVAGNPVNINNGSAIFDSDENLKIHGMTALGTGAYGVIGIADTTAPSTNPTDGCILFAEDGEGFMADENGNFTLETSHKEPPTGFDPNDAMPHSLHSYNIYVGKAVTVDVTGAIKELEQLTGKQFVHVEDLPADRKKDWHAEQQAAKAQIEAARLAAGMKEEIEISAADARELVEETTKVAHATTRPRYYFNAETGEAEQSSEQITEYTQQPTGRMIYRLKSGVRFDKESGKFYRRKLASEVTVEPYVIKEPPTWIADRM